MTIFQRKTHKNIRQRLCFLPLFLALCCLISLCPEMTAAAQEPYSNIPRSNSKDEYVWIVEICTASDADAGTTGEFTLIPTRADGTFQPLTVNILLGAKKWCDLRDGAAMYYSNNTSGKKDDYTYPYGLRVALQPNTKYYFAFSLHKDYPLEKLYIQPDYTNNPQNYDNLKISYVKTYRLTSGTIGDLAPAPDGSFYRSFDGCTFDSVRVCNSCDAFDLLAQSQNPNTTKPIIYAEANPIEKFGIPLNEITYYPHFPVTAKSNYLLRLITKEGGTYTGNMRIHIYAQDVSSSSLYNYPEELAATIDLDQAALNQGKPLSAHDLTENRVLDIPFTANMLSHMRRDYSSSNPWVYERKITRIVLQPMGETGTGWLPASIAVIGPASPSNDAAQTLCQAKTITSRYDIGGNYLTPSMENNYYMDGTRPYVLAWWDNEDNIGVPSGTNTELLAYGGQIGRQLSLLDAKFGTASSTTNGNYTFSPTLNSFYLGFQTKDLLESSMSLDYSSDINNPQLTSVYIDVTYRTNAGAFYETSTYKNNQERYSYYSATNPDTRTMRFYLVEGAWTALQKRGIDSVNNAVFNSLFTHGQTDYVPIALLDMATGTADDIISIKLGSEGLDQNWELNSFSIYTEEPDLPNLDQLSKVTAGDHTLAIHPDVTFKNYPILYYAPPSGIQLMSGGNVTMETRSGMSLVKPNTSLEGYFYEASSPYHPFEPMIYNGNTYLFVMRPSALESAHTDSDMMITLNYIDHDNINQNVSFQLNDALRTFYGAKYSYLPQSRGDDIQFALEVNNVKTFLSATITLSDTGKQFQFEEISIYQVKEVDNQIYYTFHIPEATLTSISPSSIERRVDRGDLLAKVSRTTYLGNSSTSKTLGFIDYSTGDPVDQNPSTDTGLTSIKSEMAYHEINKDLKLSSVRSRYEIQVDVSSIADAGSSNYFFFQLVFENGTSGVVLANEQIAGDAFRQGETSVFSIMTNQYYGQPKSMRIYTHSSNTEDTTSFDKLNIDKINIIRQSGIGLSTSWVIENVGWIDINYSEEDISGLATKMNASSDSAPNNTSVCREYAVTKNSAAMDFMVEFKVSDNTESLDPNLTAQLSYRKTTGANATMNLNVTEMIDEFNGVNGAAYVKGDLSRFYISLNDVASINQITFQNDKETDFKLQDLRIYRVSAKGDVFLDSTGRYNREGELTFITNGAMEDPRIVRNGNPAIINLAVNQNMNVSFTTASDGTTSFTSGASVQTNVAEKLNIYIYPGSNTRFRSNLYGALKYTGTYQSGFMQKSLHFGTENIRDDGVIALRGVDINNLGSISSLTLSCDDSADTSVSHVIIERVNTSNRKIKTYNINFASSYLLSPVQAYVNTDDTMDDMKQTVTITTKQLDPLRLSKTNDIGVAIRYRSSLDNSVQYISDYVYLSQQAKSSLSKGEPVTATLYEQNVGEITGVSIITTGNVTLSTDTIYACNYNQHDELLYATGIAMPLTITPESGNVNRATYHDTTLQNAATVMPVTFTFKTAEDTTKLPVAGTYSKVYGVLVCEDPGNSERTVEINLGNLRDYFSKTALDEGEVFQAGNTDTFTAYLYNTGDPLELRLEMDSENNDPWTLSEVTVRRKLSDGSYATKSGIGDIISADQTIVIDLRTLSAEEQINAQQPEPAPTPTPTPEVPGDNTGSGGNTGTGSGNTSGDNTGTGSGTGNTPGDNTGTGSGTGNNTGTGSGNTSGDNTGTGSGTGNNTETGSGNTSGDNTGTGSGTGNTPGDNTGTGSGNTSGDNTGTGTGTGNTPDTNTSNTSDSSTGNGPENTSGTNTSSTPGSSTGNEAEITSGSSSDRGSADESKSGSASVNSNDTK